MDPLHITEFASPRYFDKLKTLAEAAENANVPQPAPAPASGPSQTVPFSLPIGNPRPQPGRRRRSDDTVRSGDHKKRALGHDLTTLRTRRPSFATSIASFRSKVATIHRTPSTFVEHEEFIFQEEPVKEE
jgi:hypothetical protein